MRPRDLVIHALAGETFALERFNVAANPVLSSVSEVQGARILRTEYVPQVPLDEACRCLDSDWICVLSTDTEGQDLQVLRGGTETLKRTLLVCVEYADAEGRHAIEAFLGESGFAVVYANQLNIILRNEPLWKQLRR